MEPLPFAFCANFYCLLQVSEGNKEPCLLPALGRALQGTGWAADRHGERWWPWPPPRGAPRLGVLWLPASVDWCSPCIWGLMKIMPPGWVHWSLREGLILFSGKATNRLSLFCPPGYLQKYLEAFWSPLRVPNPCPTWLQWEQETWMKDVSFTPLEKKTSLARKQHSGYNSCIYTAK